MPEIMDHLYVTIESLDEMYACWQLIVFVVESPIESTLELMDCMNLNN